MSAALRTAGLAQRLNLHDIGDLTVAIDSPQRDTDTGIIGFRAVCETSDKIRTEIGALLKRGERLLVVGGCCTLLIGVFAALREHFGRVALAFVDGHLDYYDGRTSPTGEAADMELAILTGFGPTGLIDLGGPPPLVIPQDVIALGCRDAEQARIDGAPDPLIVAPGLTLFDAHAVKQTDPITLGVRVAKLFEDGPGQLWVHFDLDVLDPDIFPAVDYRMPYGLNWREAAGLMRPLAESRGFLGMDVTIYNPNLDPDRRYAEQIISTLADVLAVRPYQNHTRDSAG